MMSEEIVRDLVSRITYKPGWAFSVSYCSETGCDVLVEWDVVDTSFPPNYEVKLFDSHGYRFDTRVYIQYIEHSDVIDVARAILDQAIKLEAEALVHESREFFRINFVRDEEVDPGDEGAIPLHWRYNAVFHPHKVEGVEMWNDTDTGFDYRFATS